MHDAAPLGSRKSGALSSSTLQQDAWRRMTPRGWATTDRLGEEEAKKGERVASGDRVASPMPTTLPGSLSIDYRLNGMPFHDLRTHARRKRPWCTRLLACT